MSFAFLVLKAGKVWETPYDVVIGLVLVDLDLIVLCELRRLWLHARGR